MIMEGNIASDRSYWRHCSTKRLIEEARHSDHELCIALGERLEDLDHADRQLEAIMDELDELRRNHRRLVAMRDEQLDDENEND